MLVFLRKGVSFVKNASIFARSLNKQKGEIPKGNFALNKRECVEIKNYSEGFVLGRAVTLPLSFHWPLFVSKSIRSNLLRTLRFLDDAELPLFKLLCCDINLYLVVSY